MKIRDKMLWMVVVATASIAGCAVCDTCDDFPAPCVGPNCGQNGMPAYMNGSQGEGMPVMGAATPTGYGVNDAAGPAPTMPGEPNMPPAATMPAPTVDPTTPPAPMETTPR